LTHRPNAAGMGPGGYKQNTVKSYTKQVTLSD
jgi:hypothetical protein